MTAATLSIEQPGVYEMPPDRYLADPVPGGSLSVSGARKLLPPSCPALFRHYIANGRPPKREFDFGHAAHLEVLGEGPALVVIGADDWRTKAAKDARDEAHAAGLVPLLAADYERVQAMAAALRAHPFAAALFRPGSGKPEQSLFWADDDTGVWLRGRLDWLPEDRPRQLNGRIIVPDYKTCVSASPEALSKAFADHGYAQQAAWYLDGLVALNLATDPAFVFVCQEKQPPYLVTVAEPDDRALEIGRLLNRRAIDVYAECVATGEWPAYSSDVELIGLPRWVERRHLEDW